MPLVTFAQQVSVQAEAVTAAEADAEASAQKSLWFVIGCGLPVVGIAGAYLLESSPPASRLLGKSPEYVVFYTDAYKAKGKNIQVRTALTGCAIIGGVCVAYYAYSVFTIAVYSPLWQ